MKDYFSFLQFSDNLFTSNHCFILCSSTWITASMCHYHVLCEKKCPTGQRTQETLERLRLSTGLGTPLGLPRGAGGSYRGEGSLAIFQIPVQKSGSRWVDVLLENKIKDQRSKTRHLLTIRSTNNVIYINIKLLWFYDRPLWHSTCYIADI